MRQQLSVIPVLIMLALDHGLLHNVEINANFNFFFRRQVSEGGKNRQE
jgi:hypothetical protein